MARGGLLLLLLLSTSASAWASAFGDGPALDRIDAVRPLAQAVVVDGSDADWTGIPEFADPNGDGNGTAGLDILSASIAPLADEWLIRIETRGPPSASGISLRIRVDYREQRGRDLELGFNPTFTDFLCWWTPDNFFGGCAAVDDTTIAIAGNVMEVRVPLSELTAVLPAAFATDLVDPNSRSWLRITPFSELFDPNTATTSVVDTGPAIGSFRLLTTPFPLDPPLLAPDPNAATSPVVTTELPLPDIQLVDQGAGGLFSHAGKWGYDFNRVDNALELSAPAQSPNNPDYFSWGDEIRAPVAGTFFSSETNQIDQNPQCTPFDPNAANGVNFAFMDAGGGTGLLFSHSQTGSIPPLGGFGTPIAKDALLGLVGNAGSHATAHLHYGAELLVDPNVTLPIELDRVEVGLNPTEDDPWLRRLNDWGIREGFFVRAAAPLCGDVTLDRTLAADDLSALRAFLADPAGMPLPTDAQDRCTVVGVTGPCSIADVVVLTRRILGPVLEPEIEEVCTAAVGPC